MSFIKLIIQVVAPMSIGKMFGGDGAQPGQPGQPGQQQGLVAPPDPAKIFKKSVLPPFSFDKPTPTRDRVRIVGEEPALEAVDPSTMESKYWSAIFSDAKSKSRISLTGIRERRD